MTLPPLYDESDYEALRAEKDARIAALEHIIGRQEEELHQGELRIAELEAKLKWAMGLNACIEHERAEKAEAELAAPAGGWIDQLRTRTEQAEAELAALKSAELSEHRLAREEAEAELATKEKECQEQFRQLLGAGETFNRMNAELAALKCCGNCRWFRAEEYQYCGCPETLAAEGRNYYDQPYYISAPDKCDFTPSRWTARSE